MNRTLPLLLLAALALTACGGNDDSTAAATTDQPDQVVEPAATTNAPDQVVEPPATTAPTPVVEPVVTTSVPVQLDADAPDLGRVIAFAGDSFLADVLALGVTPIASAAEVEQVGFQGIDEFDTSGIEPLSQTNVSLEYLATLRPDTILTYQFWVNQIDAGLLDGLGNLIIVPDGLPPAERITVLGDLLGRPEHAAAIVADLAVAEQNARDRVGEGCTLSLATIYAGPSVAAFVDGPWDIPTAIQTAGCEIVPGPGVAEPDQNGRAWLSMEQLGLLDQDLLVLLQNSTVDGETEAVDEIEANPIWQTLPAVQAGNVVIFDRLGYAGVTGLVRFYDEFGALLD
ncbi:MAG TPA: ABC transporter substrate-binding protein [Ilumatobacter sp.]|nr:ABC transporter substrate-binding protein [Ilumatobacter sp.]